jgi:hypothetical protein
MDGARLLSISGDGSALYEVVPGSPAEDFLKSVKPAPAGHAPMSAVRFKSGAWRVSQKVSLALGGHA